MEITHCKQTIKYNNPRQNDSVRIYPLHWIEPESEVRIGFTKGTLKKATFELETGATIIYEKWRSNG